MAGRIDLHVSRINQIVAKNYSFANVKAAVANLFAPRSLAFQTVA
jgi:hypothetical protein